MSDTETKTPEPAEEQQQQQQQDEEPATAAEKQQEEEGPTESNEPAAETSDPKPEVGESEEPASEEKPAESSPEDKGEEKTDEVAKGEDEDAKKKQPEEEEEIEISPEGSPYWLSTDDIQARGLPDNEVENFRNFYFKYTHSVQHQYEALKDFALETEFITLFKEDIEVLSKEGDLNEEEQQVLDRLKERINSAIELYNGDGALIKICDRSAKDATLERSDESFIQTVRDSVINALEVEKQTICAYSIWKDIQPSVFQRGVSKIRSSLRRRSNSASRRRTPALEEDKKTDEPKDETPPAPKEDGEAKPAADGEVSKDAGAKVTVEVEIEAGGDAPAEAAKEEEPEAKKEEPEAKKEEPEAKETEVPAKEEEPAKEPEVEAAAPKEGEDKKEEGEKKEEGAGGVEPAEEKEEKKEEAPKAEGEAKPARERRSLRKSFRRKKKPEGEQHRHKAAKEEPLDNRVLRAFGRAVGGRYQVLDGESAIKQLRSSGQIRSCLNSLKPFCGADGVKVSLSVIRWNSQLSDNRGMIFRGFVFDNELRAISQYDDIVYFPNVVHYKDSVIRGKIQTFFDENIKSILGDLKNYLIDFFVGPEKTYVIRLNPFLTTIGACLFTWTENKRELVRGPIQMRVVETPKQDPFSSYQEKWRDMLNSVVTQRSTESRANRSNQSCTLL